MEPASVSTWLHQLQQAHGTWAQCQGELSASSALDAVRLLVARGEGSVPPMFTEGPVRAGEVEQALAMAAAASREWEAWQVRLVALARDYHLTWDQIARAQGLSSKAAAYEAHRRRMLRTAGEQ